MSVETLKPCEAFLAQLGARATGGLDEPAGAALEAHLAGGCVGCAALAAELESELDLARLPEEDPAPGGWERVLLRLDGAAPAAPNLPAPVVRLRCAFCHDDLRRAEAACCAACLAPHHPDCFAEHGRCAAPGCAETRVLRAGAPPVPVVTTATRRPLRLILGLVVGGCAVAALAELSRRGEVASREGADRRAAERVVEMQQLLAEYQAAGRPQTEPEPTFDGKPLAHWIDVLGDSSEGYRETAISALTSMGEPAFAALLQALESSQPLRRQGAIRALGSIGSKAAAQAAPALMRAVVGDPDEEVRRLATQAWFHLAQDLPPESMRAGLQTLGSALPRAGVGVRRSLALELNRHRNLPEGRAIYRDLLRDPEPELRELAATRLIESSDPEPDERLAWLFAALRQDESPQVRVVVAGKLGELALESSDGGAPVEILDALATALQDPDDEVRDAAASQLANHSVSSPRHLGALLEALPGTRAAADSLLQASFTTLATLVPGLSQRSQAAQAGFLRLLLLFSWERDETTPLFEGLAGYFPHAPSPELRVRAARLLAQASRDRPDRQALAAEALDQVVADVVSVLAAAPAGEMPEVERVAIELAHRLGERARAAAPALASLARPPFDDVRRGWALNTLAAVAPVDSGTEAAVVAALQPGTGKDLLRKALSLVGPVGGPCREALLERAPVLLSAFGDDADYNKHSVLEALLRLDLGLEELRALEPALSGLRSQSSAVQDMRMDLLVRLEALRSRQR